MNLNELWSGTDYAYYSYKGRGELYRSTALRVKVIRAYKDRVGGNERLSGFAEVLLIDRETGEPELRPNGEHRRMQVRARDIAMRWEEYAELHAQRVEQQKKAEEERRQRREAAEAERRRIEALENEKKDRVKRLLTERYNIPEHYIDVITAYYVTISRAELEREADVYYATINQ